MIVLTKALHFSNMPFYKSYSENTLKKALHWLDQQDQGWPQHIKDRNIAVQMYLKSQKQEEEESSFPKELQDFLGPNMGAVSTDFNKRPPAKATAPCPENKKSFFEKEAGLNKPLLLDEKSRQALEMAKKELNIQSDEEALRLMIQLGRKSLNRL